MINPWFKFYGSEYLSDPKIGSLTPQERSCWITLLCLSGTSSVPGIISFLTVEVLLEKSGIKFDPYYPDEWDKCLSILKKLEKMKMIKTSESGSVEIINWTKRQETTMTATERSRKYRLKTKESNENATSATKCNENATLEENRIEENRIESIVASDTPFSLKEEIKKLNESERRDLNIIGLFFEERNPNFENRKQYNTAIKRHIKPANQLKDFSDTQLIDAIEYAKKEYKEIYTLETLLKILTK